jgi:molybdopterin/thiamine biosynthesis adenylyltransferase
MERIRIMGDRFRFLPIPDSHLGAGDFDRQTLLLGKEFTAILSSLRIGIVGCGGTGSPTAMMLARLGVGQLVLMDDDLVQATNIHRLHGVRLSDVGRPKVEVVKEAIESIGFGTKVTAIRGWASQRKAFDHLKSCDIVFGCTDDNSGRVVLDRLAHFYLVPIFDMGLDIRPGAEGLERLLGRVTVLLPGHACLMCRGVIDTALAQAETLQRTDPDRYEASPSPPKRARWPSTR